MGSRILPRVLATLFRWWAEHLELLDDNQDRIRQETSAANATQIIVRMREDLVDIKKRRATKQFIGPINKRNDPEARLLDLHKAHPRVFYFFCFR